MVIGQGGLKTWPKTSPISNDIVRCYRILTLPLLERYLLNDLGVIMIAQSLGTSLAFGAVVLMSPLLATSAHAGGTYSGTVSGFFSDPALSGSIIALDGSLTPLNNSATAVTTGFGTNDITWGSTPGSSHIAFIGDTFSGVSSGQTFHLGTLIYSNGTSGLNTLIFGSSFHLITGGVADELVTSMSILTTANTGLSAARDADFVGFSGLTSTFNVFEGATSSIELFGRIVGDPQLQLTSIALTPGVGGGFIGHGLGGVPEPETWAMMILGLSGVGLALRRRRAIAA